jgi:predicted DNA-binding transcriptional regulator YafY
MLSRAPVAVQRVYRDPRPTMPRPKDPRPIPRPQVRILVLRHLERAGATGMTKLELLTAIGPTRTSLPTIQRAINELRSDYDAQITSFGKIRRWRLEAPLAIPLEAPEDDDQLAVLLAQVTLEPLGATSLLDRLTKVAEGLDDRARRGNARSKLPPRRSMSSNVTLGTDVDLAILRRMITACRGEALQMQHASPWPTPRAEVPWQEIEPWALRLYDGALYLRAWVTARRGARTFRLADIQDVRDSERAASSPRHARPIDVWEEEDRAFGIDHDRPDVAVIRFRGGVARWVKCIKWHKSQRDRWIEPRELLERTIRYRSCRELARRLASLLDGIESIEPVELEDEVIALVSRAAKLRAARVRARRARAHAKAK